MQLSPFVTKNHAAEFFQISQQTVESRLKEMRKLSRYGRFTIEDNQILRINVLALADYLMHRQEIKAGINPGPYDPLNIRRTLGWI